MCRNKNSGVKTLNMAELQQEYNSSQEFDGELQFDNQEDENQVNFYNLCI